MANDGRVSSTRLHSEYTPSEVGHASSVQVEAEYYVSSLGHVSGTRAEAEYMPTTIGHESALYVMVEYSDAVPIDLPLIQGEEQLQLIQFQGSEQSRGPGQIAV